MGATPYIAKTPPIASAGELAQAFETMEELSQPLRSQADSSCSAGGPIGGTQVAEAEFGPGEEPGSLSGVVTTHTYHDSIIAVHQELLRLQRLPSGLVAVHYLPPRTSDHSWSQVVTGAKDEVGEDDLNEAILDLFNPVEALVGTVVNGTNPSTDVLDMQDAVFGPAQSEVDVETLHQNVARFTLVFAS